MAQIGVALVLGLLLQSRETVLFGADRAFVGVLALAVEDDVSAKLGLSPETKQKIQDLIDRRENDVVDLTLQLKGLSAAEQVEKLAPFVAESERLGLALLSESQRKMLAQMRISRDGMSTLADDKIAKQIGLDDQQRTQIDQLVKQHESAVGVGSEQERQVARARFERELTKLLTKDQRAAWEKLAGLTASNDDDPPAETEDSKPAQPSEKPDTEKPDTEKPESESSAGTRGTTKPGTTKPGTTKPGTTNKETSKLGTGSKSKNGDDSGDDPLTSKGPAADGLIEFKFRFAPFKDVLTWFADQANLSLDATVMPTGTFNLYDQKRYTPSEAIDILNSSLLIKGFTLIRREGMLIVWNLEDPIPDPLVELVTVEELDKRGKYELVKCIFPLSKMTPEDAEKEISKLIGPTGTVVVLPQARQIMVRETGAKLRAIRELLAAVENPDARKDEKLMVLHLMHLTPEEFMMTARPVLGMPENSNAAPDGALRISIDALNNRLLVAGKAERIQRVEEIHKLLDVISQSRSQSTGLPEEPQLEIYSSGAADPTAVLQVLQTLLGGDTAVRLTTDPKTGNLVALAKPSQHSTIRETLKQMQRDASEIKVITLRRVDPQTALVAINKLFGGDEKGAHSNAPKIECDSVTRQLLIKGTLAQVQQIQSLLEQMGESDAALALEESERGNVRLLPLTGRAARLAIEQVEMLWPTVGKNRIRVMTHSSSNGGGLPSRHHQPADKDRNDSIQKGEPTSEDASPTRTPASGNGKSTQGGPTVIRRSAAAARPGRFEFASFADDEPVSPSKPAKAKAPATDSDAAAKKAKARKPAATEVEEEPAEIVITVGPAGIVIASEDTDALDRFEALLKTIIDRSRTNSKEPTIFFLKFAKADVTASLLQEVLSGASGGDSGGGGGGGGSLLGDLASGMLGDMGGGGGLLGSLLGGGGGGGGKILTAGSVSIVADGRLNALFVQAGSSDLDLIEQLLQIIDQEGSPEDVQTQGRPRFIKIQNTSAEEVATVVRQVYASRITGDTNQQQRQPSPEDLVRALRGGRGRDNRAEAKAELSKMTIGVEPRSNLLIVTAPEPLFAEVKLLVDHLDMAAGTNRGDQSMTVVAVKRANPDLMQKALQAMGGSNVKINASKTPAATPGGAAPATGQAAPASPISPEQLRMLEMFNGQRGGGGGRGGRGGGGPGGGGGGPFGGGGRPGG